MTFNDFYQSNPYNRYIGIEELDRRVLRFHFLNGNIDFREDNYGAYAISSGCGSGKTTNIKNLIDLRWYEGVLYSAFTKDELNEMYHYIITELVGRSTDPHTGEVLKKEDVIVLHSDFMAPGVDMNLFRNHPEELANKKIILCTHAKLLDEPLEVLLASRFNQRIANSVLPPLNTVVTGKCDSYPRQWVIIDEGIEARERIYDILPETFPALGELAYEERRIDYSHGYKRWITVSLTEPKLVRKFNFYSDFIKNVKGYSEYVVGRNLLSINPDNELNTIKFHQVATELFNNFDMYAARNKAKGSTKIPFNFTGMIMEDMKFHLLLFDGTSDLTLSTSSKFTLLNTNSRKYNSPVNLTLLPFNLNRRLKAKDIFGDVESYVTNEMDKMADMLESIIRQNNQTLIFTWRNFKGESDEINDDIDEDVLVQSSNRIIINNKLSIPSYVSMKLRERGLIEGQHFSIEYYGSGKDKAVNDYRDYDSVVLLGRYNVPNSAISDFNRIYDAYMTGTEYYTNRVIQAVCRTRIRKHQGLPINLYMTSDWSSDVINMTKAYLNVTQVNSASQVNPQTTSIVEIQNRLKLIKGVTPSRVENLTKLCLYDPNLLSHLESNTPYTVNITLTEIYSMIPMCRKKSDMYKKLVSYLSKLDIELNIIN